MPADWPHDPFGSRLLEKFGNDGVESGRVSWLQQKKPN